MFAVNQQSNNISYNYDRDQDVLYLYVGEQSISYADEPYRGIYIKYSDSNDKLTGAVILDFMERDNVFLNSILPGNINFQHIKNNFKE